LKEQQSQLKVLTNTFMKVCIQFTLFLTLLLSSCASKKAIPAYDSGPVYSLPIQAVGLKEAIEQADKEGKNILLNVGASWCLPCKIMAKEVLSLAEVQDYIQGNYIYYYCDAEKANGPMITELYHISSVPTLILLDRKGTEFKRNQGAMGRSELMKFIKVEH